MDEEEDAMERATTDLCLIDSDLSEPWDAEEELIRNLCHWKPVAYLRSFFSLPASHRVNQ